MNNKFFILHKSKGKAYSSIYPQYSTCTLFSDVVFHSVVSYQLIPFPIQLPPSLISFRQDLIHIFILLHFKFAKVLLILS